MSFKSTAPSAVTVSAYYELSIDIPSVAAKSTVDIQVNAPHAFRKNIGDVVVALRSDQAALNAGINVAPVGRLVNVGGVWKIEFRVGNVTASAIDPTARVFQFWQL